MHKQDLIDELNDEYRGLLELVQDFGKDDFAKPGAAGPWTARDVFAHLAYWNGEAKQSIALALRGKRPEPWLVTNVEEINARESSAGRATALYKVMDDFRRSIREVVALVEAAPEQQLQQESADKTPDGSSTNAAWVASGLIEHLRTHAEAMDIWLHAES